MTPERSKLILAAGAGFALAALLWPATAESPMGAASRPEPVAVAVEHRLIQVTQMMAERPPQVRVSPAPARLASRNAPQSPRSEGLRTRASRVLLGDGRYRPEPFPRPAR